MPERFGPYEIEGVLGRGAAGVVYRARHVELDRPVALKVLREAGPVPEVVVERFHREALAAAKLHHANIVMVHDAGRIDGTPYLAMELVEGEPLDLKKFSLRRRVAILATVADAVHHAHAQGIVHRDLKPANILVDRAGEPRIVDFGVAHVAQDMTSLTRTGTAVGTPLYMSPEQVRGQNVGPQSDVYTVGVLLYEALTGHPPFDGQSIEAIFRKILTEDTPPLKSVPTDLATVCLKALEKEPRRRYATARQLADDLRRWLSDEAIVARPPSLTYRVQRFLSRHGTLLAAGAGLACALVMGAVLIPKWAAALRAAAARQAEEEARRAAEAAQRKLQEASLYLPLEKELDLLRMKFYQPGFELTGEFERYEALVGQVRERMQSTRESPQGHYLIGRCREVVADYRGAELAYARAIALDADHVPSLLAQGRLTIERTLIALVVPMDPQTTREVVERARAATELVRRGARAAGRVASLDLDAAEAYLSLFESWGHHTAFSAQPMLERWRGEPFAEEFLLIEGLSRGRSELAKAATQVIQRMPSNFKAYFLRGMTESDPVRALADCTRSLEINARYADAYWQRGKTRARQGDDEGAIEDLTRALEIDPNNPMVHQDRGVFRHSAGDTAGAISDHTRAIELNPRFAIAYAARGAARGERGELKGALEDFARALELEPRCAPAFVNRGVALGASGDLDAALRDFDCALDIDPQLADAYGNRGNARLGKGDRAGARQDFRKAIEVAPPRWPLRADVEAILRRLGP